jgi:uncharacterized protein DUF6980
VRQLSRGILAQVGQRSGLIGQRSTLFGHTRAQRVESPHEVFRQTLASTGDRIAAIRTIRERFGMDLRQAKEIMLQAESTAASLAEHEVRIANVLIRELKQHCCEDMLREATRECDTHLNRYDCPDCLIHYSPKFREYGLIIHDGGTASLRIRFCPWCGARLPESLRDEWFAEMERRGLDPAGESEMPAEFQSAAWWLEKAE